MRWLLIKDLRILRRSPLLVTLLILYPVVVAVLIGAALTGGPEKPRVAFANLAGDAKFNLGGQNVDARTYIAVYEPDGSPVLDKGQPLRIGERDRWILMRARRHVRRAVLLVPEQLAHRCHRAKSRDLHHVREYRNCSGNARRHERAVATHELAWSVLFS